MFIPSKCKSWTAKKSDKKKKSDLFEIRCGRTALEMRGPPERPTSGSESKNAWNIVGGRNDRTVAVLLCAHHEKAGFFGKGNNHKKNRRERQ